MAIKKKKPLIFRCGGYSQSEVMVTLAIIGMTFMIVPKLLIQTRQFYQHSIARISVQRDARDVLMLLERTIRQGSAQSVVIDEAPGESPHSRISFLQVEPNLSTTPVSFYKEGNRLIMAKNGVRAVSRHLRYLAFMYPRTGNDKILSVSMVFEGDTFEGQKKSLHLAMEKIRLMNN